MAKFFGIPFAQGGDRKPVPDALQSDGSVSYTQGYGYDYEREKGDDDRKKIPRDQTNQIYHDITAAIGEIQKYGAALWQAAAAPYPLGAQVYHTDGLWVALAPTSQVPGDGAEWQRIAGRSDIVPIGVAFPYFGDIADLPANYAVCNGQNGTPDLTDRFLVGAGGQYARGDTGGSTTTGQAGSHNHTINVAGHALTVAQIPPHEHPIDIWETETGVGGVTRGGPSRVGQYKTLAAGGGQAHSHGASSNNAGQHSHSAVPPYYAAVWVMRIS